MTGKNQNRKRTVEELAANHEQLNPKERMAIEGKEWKKAVNAHTTTFELYETRPYDDCPNCGSNKYRMKYRYKGGITYWREDYWQECSECELKEEVSSRYESIGLGKLFEWIGKHV